LHGRCGYFDGLAYQTSCDERRKNREAIAVYPRNNRHPEMLIQ
jgi:hypothetical protein